VQALRPRGGGTVAPLRILFVNHTSDVSGAEVAMLRLLGALPSSYQRAVACPSGGPLAQRLAREGIEHLPIPGTAVSFRLHPRWTLVGLRDMVRSVRVLNAHVRRWRADVVHANGTRAGLLAARIRPHRAPALVVQVHDILPKGLVATAVARALAHSAERIVVVSDAGARAFDEHLSKPAARTLRISFDQSRFGVNGHQHGETRRALSVADDAPLLGEVAQITPWKGQLVAIEALALLHKRYPRAQLLLVGDVAFAGPSVRYDNAAYARQLRDRVAELGLEDSVHFLGRREDVPAIMAALDLLLLPSWDEPFGTVVAEAMACGTVPLVTSEGGPREIVQDAVTGRVLPPRDAQAWASAAADLLDQPQLLADMGFRAAQSVGYLTDAAYAEHAVQIYEQARASVNSHGVSP